MGALILSTSSIVYAQDSSATATKSDLAFSGSVMGGIRSFLSGSLKNTDGAGQTLGGYVRPSFALDYTSNSFTANGYYEFESTGARGFGDGIAEKSFSNNIYFKHNPGVFVTGKLNETWGTTILVDFVLTQFNSDQNSNLSEIGLEPMITAKLSDSVTLFGGYSLYRTHNLDASLVRSSSTEGRSFFAQDAAEPNFSSINFAIAQATSNLIPNTMNRHVAKLGADTKLTSSTSLHSYVFAGRVILNDGSAKDAYVYRIHNDLSTKITPDLSLKLRYRINISDEDNNESTKWNHLGRIIGSYDVTENLSLYLENTAVFSQAKAFNSSFTYENENYLGLNYSF